MKIGSSIHKLLEKKIDVESNLLGTLTSGTSRNATVAFQLFDLTDGA